MSDLEDGSSPLIQACPGCGSFIDVSEQEPFAQVHCPSCGTLLRVRTQFRNYTLQQVMGVGGMGTVFKALDLNLQRHVALKVLRKEYSASDEDIGKLEREARITAMVNHPNVVKIFSFGNDHGQFFIAMELVEKGSLDDLLEIQGQVAELQVLDIGLQVASGLQAAHQIGLIHRDVKPGNILFSDAHTTKIVDFGLAIVMEEEAAQRGEIWGTPYYVAPEKLDNRPEDLRSDIYSLGGTLFHALAGRPPYEAQTASLVALKHLKSQPISLQAFAPDVSSETAYVINRTLHKDPDERYQSYEELIEHLNYAKERVTAAVAGNRVRVRQRVVVESEETQSRIGAMVLIFLGVVLLAGLALFFFRNSVFPAIQPDPAASEAPGEERRRVPPEDGVTASKLEARYVEARSLIVSGDFQSAQAELGNLLENRGLDEPGRSWVQLQYGLATYLAGDTEAGDEFFANLKEELKGEDKSLTDRALLNALQQTTQLTTATEPVQNHYASLLDMTGPEALAALVFGARNWSMSAYEEAGPFFQTFLTARPSGAAGWLAEYKPLASTFSSDFRLFREVQRLASSASTPEQKLAAAAKALENAGKVQTTGGLADFLREFGSRLEEDAKRGKTERREAETEAQRVLDQKAVAALAATADAYRTALAGFNIAGARNTVEAVRRDPQLRDSSRVKNRMRALAWSEEFMTGLIKNISANPYSAPAIKNRSGAVIGDTIRSANAQGVEVATTYGATRVPWSDLPTALILEMAKHYAGRQQGTAATKELWLAGVYAHEVGETQLGKDLLLQASQGDDSLKDGLPVFFEVAAGTAN